MIDREGLDAVAGAAKVIDFYWADPDTELVAAAHAGGSLASWQVGSVDEAKAAVDAGCDLVIAQGTEAGGHVRGRVSLLPLLSDVLDAVDVPVLAAGGIGTARALAAVLAAGADGARIGTRFAAATESGAHPIYKDELVKAGAADAVLSDAFSVDCPLCPSRHGVLRSALAAAHGFDGDVVGEVQMGGRVATVRRFAGMPAPASATGHIEAMCMYAGQSVAGVHAIRPAAEIINELVSGAQSL
jgi:nitronate monooxygenase